MNMNEAEKATARLLEVMDTLRRECPWDREQTFDTLRNNTIEEVYELGYVTRGFVQVQENSHERGVRYIFENEEGNTLDFQQIPLNAENILGLDNEHGILEIKTYGNRNVYCYNSEKTCSFLWRDDKYSMLIAVDIPLAEEEILKIMDGIQIKK